MFNLVVLALLVVSQLGDAASVDRTFIEGSGLPVLQKHHWPIGLPQHEIENYKVIYKKAVEEYPLFKYGYGEETRFCQNYNNDQIHATLYTKSNPHGHKIDAYLEETISNSTYDTAKITKIIVGSGFAKYVNATDLVTAYLRHYNQSVNVVVFNYEQFFGCEYIHAARIYNKVVDTVAHFVKQLYYKGTLLDDVHVIGFGMSAHIVGAAAKELRPYKVGRITGLEPTGGIFDDHPWLGQLHDSDAKVVDVIMTNSRKYGTKHTRGTVRFYPNGGETQPGTSGDDLASHFKAYAYFVESIARPGSFKSEKALNWQEYKRGSTLGMVSFMGEYVNKRAYGDFYLNVNPVPPYSRDVQTGSSPYDHSVYRPDYLFKMTKNALQKETLQYGETFSPDVSGGEARIEISPGHRVYNYVRPHLTRI